jgi:hypothetical protein
MTLKPPLTVHEFKKTEPGPIDLRLASDRGRNPIYYVGDEANLIVSVSQTAWLYCFDRFADGRLFKLIPNKHSPEAKLTGPRRYTIPGEIAPYILRVKEPVGVDVVKCFATSRNVTVDLPPSLRSLEAQELPKGTDARLSTIFRAIPGARVSEASMVITIDKR